MFELMCLACIIIVLLVVWVISRPGNVLASGSYASDDSDDSEAFTDTSSRSAEAQAGAPAAAASVQPHSEAMDHSDAINQLFAPRGATDGDTRLAEAMHNIASRPLEATLARARVSADSARAEYEEELAESEALATQWDDDRLDERMKRAD